MNAGNMSNDEVNVICNFIEQLNNLEMSITTKQKAKELIEKHLSKMPPLSDCEKINYPAIHQAKLMALITVNEMLESSAKYDFRENLVYDTYLQNVKNEIELYGQS